jgi:hypothetical protein
MFDSLESLDILNPFCCATSRIFKRIMACSLHL